jgi:2-phospho-L-lactate guanylyltransferase
LNHKTLDTKLITLIPAKPFFKAKTRLNSVLTISERARLSRLLLARTIRLAKSIGDVAVISRSASVRQVAKREGAWALVEHASTLNAAIEQGIEWATHRGMKRVLILPIDLPLLRVSDLQQFISLMKNDSPMAIAPCHHEQGTNALLLHLPTRIVPQFGTDSFHKHCIQARDIGIEPVIYRASRFAFDLDSPDDWRQFSLNAVSSPDFLKI